MEFAKKVLSKISGFSNIAVCAVMLFIVSFLALQSVMFSTFIDRDGTAYEEAVYNTDNLIINLLLLAVFLLAVILLKRFIYRLPAFWTGFAVCLFAFVISVIWIFSVRSIPANDSKYVLEFGEQLAGIKDFGYADINQQNYFFLYPFQLGYVFVCEVFARIFGTADFMALQVLNAVAVSAMFAGFIMTVNKVYENRKITNMTSIMLAGCVQPMLMTTFVYGLILGFAFSAWAVYFAVSAIRSEGKRKWINIALCAVMIAIAYLVKPNNAVVLVAICIIFLLDFFKKLKWQSLVAIALSVVLSLSLSAGVRAVIESRLDVDFGDGVPAIAWLNMGINDSYSAPGWYNGNQSKGIYVNSGYDAEKAKEDCYNRISERMSYLLEHSNELNDFCYKKIVSQWNDPTYESIWISQVKRHDGEYAQYVKNIYESKSDSKAYKYMNIYQQTVMVFAAVGVLIVLKKKDYCATLLLLVVFGGFLYHLLFEAKSQYLVTYFTALVPICAAGLVSVADLVGKKIKKKLPVGIK